MANTTLSVLLIASLCLLVSSIPVNPGQVRGYIHMAAGKTIGMSHAAINEAKGLLLNTATDAQKLCILTAAGLAREENSYNELVLKIEKRLVGISDNFESIKSVIDEECKNSYAKTIEKIKELKNC